MGGKRRAVRRVLAALTAAAAVAAVGAGPAMAGPILAIESPGNGSSTKDTTPAIRGTSSDGNPLDQVTVAIHEGSGAEGPLAQAPSTMPSLDGSWSVTPATLADGTYTAVAEQSEVLGGPGSSPPVTFTVDTVPPVVTLETIASPTNDSTPTLEGVPGTAQGDQPAVSVTIYTGTSVGGSVAAKGNATLSGAAWSYTSQHLVDGTYTAQATQSDAAGNTGTSQARTFTVKTAAPQVTLEPVSSPSNDATPTLKGSAGTADGDEAQVTINIYVGDSVGGTPVLSGGATASGGAWSYTSTRLADGTYTAQASQRDATGNTGKSAPQTFTIDTTPPAVTLGAIQSPTKDTTPTLEGNLGSAKGDSQAVTVIVYEGTSVGGKVASSGPATIASGSWTYTSKQLKDGTYTAQAEQSDQAGNTGLSSPQTFTVKTAKPVVTLNPPQAQSNNATPSFSGSADTGPGDIQSVTLKIYSGSEPSGSALQTLTVQASGGKWQAGPVAHLPDGTYTAQAEQGDQAGNVGFSAPATVSIRTTPPAISLKAPPTPRHDSTPTLEGTRGTQPGDKPTVSVAVYEGSSVGGTPVASSSFGVSGSAFSYTTPGLADGTYTAQAKQEDEFGNVGESKPVTFTIDTVAPAVTFNPVPSPSNDSTPTLGGSAGNAPGDRSTIEVTIYEGSSAGGKVATSGPATRTGSTWSYKSALLKDATYTAQATQTDEAENVGLSATQTFTINTAPPTVTMSSPAPLSNNTTPSFSGTASDTTPVTVSIYSGPAASGTPVRTLSASVVSGSWSSAPVSQPLADGQYTAIATQRSSIAGNPEGRSAPATFKVNTAAPTVTLAQPTSPSNHLTPSFTGTASDTTPVTIKVFEGERPTGTPVSEATATPVGEAWTSSPAKPALLTGKHTYTAVASQKSSLAGNPEGTSVPVIFTVDTTAPTVTLNQLVKVRSNDSTPSFTGTASDTTAVTVNIYKGKVVQGSPVATATRLPSPEMKTTPLALASAIVLNSLARSAGMFAHFSLG